MTSVQDEELSGFAVNSRGGDESAFRSGSWLSLWPVVTAVFLSFVLSSVLRRPVPSVNEPHYLCKAKHYWQPEWCAGDLFLESSNPHQTFYQTVGLLTRWLTLEQTAWVGRILALGSLSCGWTLLFSRLVKLQWAALAAAWIFLLLQSLGSFSGEWLVGGVESKVFAYAFVFLGLAFAIDGRFLLTGFWIGIAISFHPIVGLWSVVAGGISAIGWLLTTRISLRPLLTEYARSLIGAGVIMCVASLPGLVPAMRVLSENDRAVTAEADLLQVGERLAHHLDPARFPLESYRYYSLILILIALLWQQQKRTHGRVLFAAFVTATVLIALSGLLIGWGSRPLSELPFSDTRVWLLKFYPFRLADLFVPMLLTVTVLAAVSEADNEGALTSGRQRFVWVLSVFAFILSLLLPSADRNPSRMLDANRSDWIAACEWLRQESASDSLVYAANENWAVKWFSHRAEYVNYKDCPQDAAGIIEWARRLRLINRWARESLLDGTISPSDLVLLHAETGIDYLIVSRFGPIDADPVYSNDTFDIHGIRTE